MYNSIYRCLFLYGISAAKNEHNKWTKRIGEEEELEDRFELFFWVEICEMST